MSGFRPLTILLAEDSEDHAELIIDTLKDFNVANHIVHVNNGEEVVHFLTSQLEENGDEAGMPDLVLLDLKMPRMDGSTALAEIRKIPQFKHLPVIMISTSSIDSEIKKCYELGANSYVTKPIKFGDFCKKIKELNLYWVLTAEIPRGPHNPDVG